MSLKSNSTCSFTHLSSRDASPSDNNDNDDDDDRMSVKELNVGEEPSIFELLLTVCSKLSVASMCKHNPVSEATAGKESLNFLVLAAVT